MKTKRKTQRKIDQTAQKNYSKLSSKFSLVKKNEIKRLQFLIVTAFSLGVIGAVVWGFKSDLYSGSEAASRKTTSTIPTKTTATINTSDACQGATSLSYNGDTYKIVPIGTQCWFAENLRTANKPDGTPLVKGTDYMCYESTQYPTDNDPNCASPNGLADKNGLKYGALYSWEAAMNNSSAAITAPGPQGICPSGWHIPTDSEQYTLENYLKDPGATCDPQRISLEGSCNGAGGRLMFSTDYSSSKFNFPLAGFYNGISYKSRGANGGFWSATTYADSVHHWFRSLAFGMLYVDRIYQYYPITSSYDLSVRCVKN